MNLKNGRLRKFERKIRETSKYLIDWKKFNIEHSIWEKKKDLENAKEAIAEFKERIQKQDNKKS